MANAEHLKILKEGVERWNKWRIEEDAIPDLSNAYLAMDRLIGFNLFGTNLKGANLSGADLTSTNLINANLSNAELNGAQFSHADMFNIDLSSAQLGNTNLIGVNLGNANLCDAYLFAAQFNEANMHDVKLNNADLRNAALINTNLRNANLNNVNLSRAIIIESNFFNADLTGAVFSNALISRTILASTSLSKCIGLESIEVNGPCSIDLQTLRASPNLPKSFLLKIGLPELYIDYLPEFYQPEGIRLYPVFLSHSSINKPFARKLYEALIARGVSVFFDEKKMMPGDNLYESISKGIEYYDKMILVCSKESLVDSWWVDREIDRILAKERDLFKEVGQQVNLLIPVTIDDYVFQWNGAKKEDIKRNIIGDFKNWEDDAAFEDALNKLIRALNVDRPDIKPVSYLLRKAKP